MYWLRHSGKKPIDQQDDDADTVYEIRYLYDGVWRTAGYMMISPMLRSHFVIGSLAEVGGILVESAASGISCGHKFENT
jgi:hypothetical protein